MQQQHSTQTSTNSKIIFNKYKLLHLLGHGSSAHVYLAIDLSSNTKLAIKAFCKPSSTTEDTSIAIIREISALKLLKHDHITRLLEVLATKTKIYLVLELAEGGELLSLLSANGKLSEHNARIIFRQLVSAVSYSHSKGVFHRDLKLENLLLDANGNLKVSDFGLAAFDDANRSNRADGLLRTLCGTPAYVAPEILGENGNDGAGVDVWACGVILFVIAAGYLTFNDYSLVSMYRKIYSGRFRCPTWMSPELCCLLCQLLDPNPETRITIQGIVGDPWFSDGFGDGEWTEMVRSRGGDEGVKTKRVDDEGRRALNAFHLISFSSGLDLSGLLNVVVEPERFVVKGSCEWVLGRFLEMGRSEGLITERIIDKKGFQVVIERQNGDFVSKVSIFELANDFILVEVNGEGEFHGQNFWREKLQCDFKAPHVDLILARSNLIKLTL